MTLLLCAVIPMPAIAQPHEIAELGTAPLIGEIASTAQLQNDASAQRRLFEAAGAKLGLTRAEYAQFSARIASRRLSYVTIPRHLDAMTWSSGGHVHVLRDVVIPAHTHGWEIDLQEDRETVALFIPARCGNLSILRKPRPALARAVPATPSPAATPVAEAADAPAPAIVLPPTAAATPAPYQAVALSTPQRHHARLWPLLLLPLLALIGGHHSGAPAIGTSSIVAPPAPSPPPVSCPTPAPSH